MSVHIIRIELGEEEERLVNVLSKRDGVRVNEELLNLLKLQIREEMELMEMENDDY